jgi:hypothetical protein
MRFTGAKMALATAMAIGGTALPALGGSTAAEAATSSHVLVTCGGSAAVRPVGFVITCHTVSSLLTRLKWTSWGRTAAGKGTAFINSCKPTCNRGRWGSYQVTITLSQPKAWHRGKSYYSKLLLSFAAGGPAGVGKTLTFTLSGRAAV